MMDEQWQSRYSFRWRIVAAILLAVVFVVTWEFAWPNAIGILTLEYIWLVVGLFLYMTGRGVFLAMCIGCLVAPLVQYVCWRLTGYPLFFHGNTLQVVERLIFVAGLGGLFGLSCAALAGREKLVGLIGLINAMLCASALIAAAVWPIVH